MGQMDSVHFCRFICNSPGKLIGTVIIHFVHESFINVASDSSPGSNDSLSAQTRRGVFLQGSIFLVRMLHKWQKLQIIHLCKDGGNRYLSFK